MKTHFPLTVALLTVVFTVGLLAWFIRRTRQIVDAQAVPTIQLPPPSREQPIADSDTLRLKLTTEGIVYVGEKVESEARLGQIINGNLGKRIILEIAPGVNYEETKMFLRKLNAAGVKNISVKIDKL